MDGSNSQAQDWAKTLEDLNGGVPVAAPQAPLSGPGDQPASAAMPAAPSQDTRGSIKRNFVAVIVIVAIAFVGIKFFGGSSKSHPSAPVAAAAVSAQGAGAPGVSASSAGIDDAGPAVGVRDTGISMGAKAVTNGYAAIKEQLDRNDHDWSQRGPKTCQALVDVVGANNAGKLAYRECTAVGETKYFACTAPSGLRWNVDLPGCAL